MATQPKKTPAKGKTNSTAMVAWEEKMAAAAKKQASSEKDVASFQSISVRGGILSVDDTALPDNELRCVVLMAVHENQYFEGAFDPNSPQIPVCYAFAGEDDDEDEMAPHTEVAEPLATNCSECEMNVFGSAEVGRGKACKNVRRLALITEDALEDDLSEAEVRILKVPVTSVKNWSKYVKRLNEEMQRPSWGVVTLIKVVPDAKTQFKVQFSFESMVEVTQEIMEGIEHQRTELARTMMLPYQEPAEEQAPPPRRAASAKMRGNAKAPAKPAARASAKPGRPAPKAAGGARRAK